MAHQNRDVVPNFDDAVGDVLDLLDEADAPDKVLDTVQLDGLRPHVDVGGLHSLVDLRQRDAVGAHGVGIDVHLVLADESPDGSDLAHAVGREQRIPNVPVLYGPQLLQVPSADGLAVHRVTPFEGVPVDLSQGGGIRAQGRLDTFRQGPGGKTVELLQYAASGPIEVDVFLEDDVNAGEAEHRVASDRLDARNPQQRDGQRIADLVVHVLWSASHPFREDDLLVFADVGDRVGRHRPTLNAGDLPVKRRDHHPPADDEQNQQPHNQLVCEAPPEQPADQRSLLGDQLRVWVIGGANGHAGNLRWPLPAGG